MKWWKAGIVDCWNDEMMKLWNDGMMEWWNEGMKEWWNDGMMEWWNDGMMEWWNDGMMKWWNDGMMEWWNDWMMDWWFDGMIVWWKDGMMERWKDGLMEWWNDGTMEQWNDGTMERWHDGIMELWNYWMKGWWNYGRTEFWNEFSLFFLAFLDFSRFSMIFRDSAYLRFAWFFKGKTTLKSVLAIFEMLNRKNISYGNFSFEIVIIANSASSMEIKQSLIGMYLICRLNGSNIVFYFSFKCSILSSYHILQGITVSMTVEVEHQLGHISTGSCDRDTSRNSKSIGYPSLK